MAASNGLRVLTNSADSAYRACPRLYRLRYVDGWESTRDDAAARRFGTLTHRGLEALWLALGAGADTDGQMEAALRAIEAEADPYDRARAAALLTGYALRWCTPRYDVIGVEVEFTAPILNPETGAASRTFVRRGKIDAIVRDREDGRKLILEHKTSSEDIEAGSDYWRRLRLDSQVSTYYRGAAALGHDVFGCVYDVLRRPAQRPLKATPTEARKYTKDGALYKTQRDAEEGPTEYQMRIQAEIAENPARYFQRGEIVRLDAEMQDHDFDTWQRAAMIRESHAADRWPRNPNSCVRYGSKCEFLEVCCGEISLDDATRFRRLENTNPELTPGEETKNADAA